LIIKTIENNQLCSKFSLTNFDHLTDYAEIKNQQNNIDQRHNTQTFFTHSISSRATYILFANYTRL